MKTLVMQRGYHFLRDDGTLRDGRPAPADGEWLEHDGPLVMCQSGLHWSKHPMDALEYTNSCLLCLIEADGETLIDTDKCCSRRRRIIARIDATKLLREFTHWCALQILRDETKVIAWANRSPFPVETKSIAMTARFTAWVGSGVVAGRITQRDKLLEMVNQAFMEQ